jgi:peptide subunit release factor 1 (eRF1)
MAATGTSTGTRELAELRSEVGALVSLVIDLDPADTPTRGDAAHRRRALIDAAHREREGLDREGRIRLDTALDALTDAELTPPEGMRVRGALVVADGEDISQLWYSRHVGDRVTVGTRAAVWEAAGHESRSTSAIILEVSRELGKASRYLDGSVGELFDAGVHAEGRHDQGGWEQADLQRWVDRQAHLHLRELADRLERLRAHHENDAIIVCGPVEATSELTGELGPWAAEHVAAVHTDIRGLKADDIRDLVEGTLAELDAGREEELLATLSAQRAREASSPHELDELAGAVSDARVSCLLTAPAVELDVFSCPQCGRLGGRFQECALDGTPMQKEPSGIDALCADVVVRDGSVWIVGDTETARALGPDGVAALTRFP